MIRFRFLTDADAPLLAKPLADYMNAMRHDGGTSMPDPAQAGALLSDDLAEVMGAFEGEALIGFAVLLDIPEAISGKRAGLLDDLFVCEAARGKRLAQKMIEHLAEVGRERGWVQLRWMVPKENAAAQRAYDRMAESAPWKNYVIWLGPERW